MEALFNKVCDYIRDPERNNEDKLIALEKDDSDISFSNLLGVDIISNERESIAPSRVEIRPLTNFYKTEKMTSLCCYFCAKYALFVLYKTMLLDNYIRSFIFTSPKVH